MLKIFKLKIVYIAKNIKRHNNMVLNLQEVVIMKMKKKMQMIITYLTLI